MRISFVVASFLLSFTLASCGTYDSDEDNSTNLPDNGNSGLGGSEDSNDGNGDASVAGLWDFSDFISTEYQQWDDDGTITIYEYQGDGEGNGQNCFELENLSYTREGDQFTFGALVQTISVVDNSLVVDGVAIPAASDVVLADLNECI